MSYNNEGSYGQQGDNEFGRGSREDYGAGRHGGRYEGGPDDSRFNQTTYGGGGDDGGNYYDKTQNFESGGYGGQHSTNTSYAGGGFGSSDDFSGAAQHANSEAGDAGDSNLFASALGLLSGKKSQLQEEDVDEDDAVQQHKKFYGEGQGGQHQADSNNVGAAAAMQALKMFSGGNSGGSHGSQGGGQSAFIGLAMAQAAKLFDQQSAQGNTHPQASKQDAVSSAAQMALKMYMKSEMGGSGGGHSSGGGSGGLLNLASKFLSK